MDTQQNNKEHHILIMAGGTGGHVFPALEVAHQAKQAQEKIKISWLGTARGLENTNITKYGYPFYQTGFSGVRGKGLGRLIRAPFSLCFEVAKAYRLIKKIQPTAVIGFGGYPSFPGAIAAKLHKLPLVIHEQNAILGSANRYLEKFADVRLSAYPDVYKRPGQWVGNPVAPPCKSVKQSDTKTTRILVLGGSQGALFLNETLPKTFAILGCQNKIEVVHQCGKKHIESTQRLYKKATFKHKVIPFIDDMTQAYASSDLIICRAGALTVAEVIQAQVPAILIPLPHAIDNHQYFNAQIIAQNQAGIVLNQHETTCESLKAIVDSLIDRPEKLAHMKQKLKIIPTLPSAQLILEACVNTSLSRHCHDKK